MRRRLIFLNAKKTYKKTLYLTEKAFKEKNLIKIAELNKKIGSKTTDECGDDWRRVHTTGEEYIRVGIVQETSTYECLEVRRRVHRTGGENIRVLRVRRRVHTTGDEYMRVPRGQERSTYDRRRVHTIGDEYIRVPRGQETST